MIKIIIVIIAILSISMASCIEDKYNRFTEILSHEG